MLLPSCTIHVTAILYTSCDCHSCRPHGTAILYTSFYCHSVHFMPLPSCTLHVTAISVGIIPLPSCTTAIIYMLPPSCILHAIAIFYTVLHANAILLVIMPLLSCTLHATAISLHFLALQCDILLRSLLQNSLQILLLQSCCQLSAGKWTWYKDRFLIVTAAEETCTERTYRMPLVAFSSENAGWLAAILIH